MNFCSSLDNRYGACKLCAPYVGKVFIDDVYSGGKKTDGNYPLLSTAIDNGLFHPNCKDGLSTWFEGISRVKAVTPEEEAEMNRREKLEQHKNYYNNQAEKNSRISEYSLDEDNKRIYNERAKQCSKKAEKIAKALEKSGGSGIITKEESPRKIKGQKYSVDWEIVDSDNYLNRLKKLSDNDKVVNSIKTRTRWALNNRDSTNTEELYAVSLSDGREITRICNQYYDSKIVRTENFTKKLNAADNANEPILLIHNHPKGLPPSITDINALLKNKNVSGITVGHNESIYYYTRPFMEIDEFDYNNAMRHFNKYSESTAMEKSLLMLSEKYKFKFQKL